MPTKTIDNYRISQGNRKIQLLLENIKGRIVDPISYDDRIKGNIIICADGTVDKEWRGDAISVLQ